MMMTIRGWLSLSFVLFGTPIMPIHVYLESTFTFIFPLWPFSECSYFQDPTGGTATAGKKNLSEAEAGTLETKIPLELVSFQDSIGFLSFFWGVHCVYNLSPPRTQRWMNIWIFTMVPDPAACHQELKVWKPVKAIFIVKGWVFIFPILVDSCLLLASLPSGIKVHTLDGQTSAPVWSVDINRMSTKY